jgi:hypothetical protein
MALTDRSTGIHPPTTAQEPNAQAGVGVFFEFRTRGAGFPATRFLPPACRHPPERLDACVESFLESMAPRIRSMAPEELSTHVAALVAAKMQRDRSLVDEAGRLWGHITSQR